MLIVDNYYLAIQNYTRVYNLLPFAIIYLYMLIINNSRDYNLLPFVLLN